MLFPIMMTELNREGFATIDKGMVEEICERAKQRLTEQANELLGAVVCAGDKITLTYTINLEDLKCMTGVSDKFTIEEETKRAAFAKVCTELKKFGEIMHEEVISQIIADVKKRVNLAAEVVDVPLFAKNKED